MCSSDAIKWLKELYVARQLKDGLHIKFSLKSCIHAIAEVQQLHSYNRWWYFLVQLSTALEASTKCLEWQDFTFLIQILKTWGEEGKKDETKEKENWFF